MVTPSLDLPPAILAQVAHALAARGPGERGGVRVVHDELADLIVHIHHLENAHAPAVARAVALGASGAAERLDVFTVRREGQARRPPAVRADHPHQALRQHRHQRRSNQVVLHAHVGEARDGAGSVVGVERGKNQVAGERGADGDIGGFAVADFTHHDDVRVLAHDVAQARGEGQADLRVDVDLVDPVHLVLHRIFDGDDLLVGKVDAFERRIERGGFAAAGGPGDQKHAVRQAGEMLHALQHAVVEAQAAQVVEIAGGAVQQAHDDALAVQRGQGGDAQIHFAAHHLDLDTPVLRQAALGDVELGHQLEARNDGGLQLARRRFLVEQHPIHPEAHAEFLLERLDVNVARALFEGIRDHGVHQADDRRFAGHIAQVFQVGHGLLVFALAQQRVPFAFSVVLLDGVQDFLLRGQHRLDLQPGEGAHGRDGFEIQRVGHGDGQGGIGQRHREGPALPQEAVRKAVDLGRRRRRVVQRDHRHAELIGKRRQHVALGDEAHIDQNLAQLVAALFLDLQGALQVFGLDLLAIHQDFAQAHGARAGPAAAAADSFSESEGSVGITYCSSIWMRSGERRPCGRPSSRSHRAGRACLPREGTAGGLRPPPADCPGWK